MPGYVCNNTVTFSAIAIVSDADPAPENASSIVRDADENPLENLDCQIMPTSASMRTNVQKPEMVVTHVILLEQDVSAVKSGMVATDQDSHTYSVGWVDDVGGMGMLWRVYVRALG